jgi:hypothetical protein
MCSRVRELTQSWFLRHREANIWKDAYKPRMGFVVRWIQTTAGGDMRGGGLVKWRAARRKLVRAAIHVRLTLHDYFGHGKVIGYYNYSRDYIRNLPKRI